MKQPVRRRRPPIDYRGVDRKVGTVWNSAQIFASFMGGFGRPRENLLRMLSPKRRALWLKMARDAKLAEHPNRRKR